MLLQAPREPLQSNLINEELCPSCPGLRWQINEGMVEDTIGFVENITEIIHSILK